MKGRSLIGLKISAATSPNNRLSRTYPSLGGWRSTSDASRNWLGRSLTGADFGDDLAGHLGGSLT